MPSRAHCQVRDLGIWEGSRYLPVGEVLCPSSNKSSPCRETRGLYLNNFLVLELKPATEFDLLTFFHVVNDG